MTEPHEQFELVEFEQVEAARGTALLRVAARPATNKDADGLTLVINDGQTEHHHKQLPTLPAPPGLLRAAFSAPIEQIRPDSTYSLAFADGELVRLTTPTRRRTTLGGAPAAGTGAAATSPVSGPATEEGRMSARAAELERRAESQKLEIAELERRLQSERERLSAAESDIDRARAERDSALAERDRAAAGDAAELERMRVAAELAHARAQVAQDETAALGERVAEAEAQVGELRREIAEREAAREADAAARVETLSAAQAETEAAQGRVARLEAEVVSLRDAVARAEAQRDYDVETAQARLQVAQAQIEVAGTEIQALRHHNAQLEARLTGLDTALMTRGAEIEVLREALAGTGGLADPPDSTYLQTRLAEARAEVSAGLLAEIELLRAQTRQSNERLTGAVSRAQAAEAELAVRTSEVEAARNAASMVADELQAASDRADRARADIEMHERRGAELSASLTSARGTLAEARDAIAAHEAKSEALADAIRAETEKRIRAEEALITATAQHALTTESLALEAVRHGA